MVRGRFRGLARPTVLARAAAAPKTTTLTVKLSAATVREVRKALGRGRKVTLVLTITATDASGNAATATRTVRLKR
jgi:hypothetical protein